MSLNWFKTSSKSIYGFLQILNLQIKRKTTEETGNLYNKSGLFLRQLFKGFAVLCA